jgi:hypothetical protein
MIMKPTAIFALPMNVNQRSKAYVFSAPGTHAPMDEAKSSRKACLTIDTMADFDGAMLRSQVHR